MTPESIISIVGRWIVAWAIEHHATLATQNRRHFARVADLKLIAF